MKTLVIIDVQNDFLKNGSLEVPYGNEVIEPINQMMKNYELVVATKDWHPLNHVSFASNHPGKKIGDFIKEMILIRFFGLTIVYKNLKVPIFLKL